VGTLEEERKGIDVLNAQQGKREANLREKNTFPIFRGGEKKGSIFFREKKRRKTKQTGVRSAREGKHKKHTQKIQQEKNRFFLEERVRLGGLEKRNKKRGGGDPARP